MNYIAIGDIHGRMDLLDKLLSITEKSYPDHRLLFLGDYVDRGPQSFEVVKMIKNLVERGVADAVVGNHEDMMIDYVDAADDNRWDIWRMNGGNNTIQSYGKAGGHYGSKSFFSNIRNRGHHQFLKSLPHYFETDELFASHAPVAAFTENYRDNRWALTWTYREVMPEGLHEMNHSKLAVCGHIHRLAEGNLLPRIYPHIVYTDTGCGCAPEGPLTGVVIEDGKYIGYIQAIPGGK